jgi:uridine phosphorylase
VLEPTLGMIIQHPANLDQELNKELLDIAKKIDCKAELGKTMCTYDFYEGNYTQLRQGPTFFIMCLMAH